MRYAASLVLAASSFACQPPDVLEPGAASPLPQHRLVTLDATPKQRPRMLPPEAFLRAYLTWFGELAPEEIARRAHGSLFDHWLDYLAAIGLPDYKLEVPRATQSNTVMLAAVGRLAEALCVRSMEHDLRNATPLASRVVFAFESHAVDTPARFAAPFDVLHRTFLGYPARLAPPERASRFYALFRSVAVNTNSRAFSPDEAGWVAVCTALVQHPETGLY